MAVLNILFIDNQNAQGSSLAQDDRQICEDGEAGPAGL